MQEILAKLKANAASPAPIPAPETAEAEAETITSEFKETTDKYGNSITYNSKQQEFINLASSGESCILIGAAGTGKTTCMKGTVTALIQNGLAGLLDAEDHKHLRSSSPGIVVCAYTRRAVANIRRNMPMDMQDNCITIHKLLEYQPVYYEQMDAATGENKNKRVFEPTRNRLHPIPPSVHTIIFEESSMIGTDLYQEVIDACPHNPQLIFLGDIQQLPPVFGPAILGFKLLTLPVVELSEVYRQALESPIISLAHRILSGNPIPPTEFSQWNHPGKMKIHPWAKKINHETALATVNLFFCGSEDGKHPGAIASGIYNPEEDIILLPFNEAFGTIELNKHIANYLARKRGAMTHEIVAGFNRYYLSPGDKILFDKEDATVLKIEKNPAYSGAPYASASLTLDYWGHDPIHAPHPTTSDEENQEAIDFMLNQAAASGEDRVRQCSHLLTIQMNDSEKTITVSKAAEVNSLLLGYCLTVHKSQGSEWRRVFFITHQSHATMLQRELLYTAITRAREEILIICEPEMFTKGIMSQRVKGNTLAEKAEFFKGKINEGFSLSSRG